MSKTFVCRELGGTCDAQFTGATFEEIVREAMPHMMSDKTHKQSIMSMEERTGETKDQWMARMQGEFASRVED
jgi:predicted small metal-binding protein